VRFTHPKVVEYIGKGSPYVATLRTYPYRPKQRVRISCGDKVLHGVVIKVIPESSTETLERYLAYSGFNTVEEWHNAAVKLHGRKPKYLVFLEVKRRDVDQD